MRKYIKRMIFAAALMLTLIASFAGMAEKFLTSVNVDFDIQMEKGVV